MIDPKGRLITLVGYDPDGVIVPLQVTTEGFIRAYSETGTGGTPAMLTPKGNIFQPIAFDPNGAILPIQVTADGFLRVNVENQESGDTALIFDTLLSAPAANVDWQNIPQTYKHLLIIGACRSSSAITGGGINIRFNNDTGNNYDYTRSFFNNGAGVGNISGVAQAFGQMGALTGSLAVANDFSGGQCWIADYVNTSFNKNWIGTGFIATARSVAAMYNQFIGGQWRNTAAINQITLYDAAGGNFIAGSRFSLYGMK